MQIYKTTNLINEKIYIGKEKRNDEKYLGSGLLLKKSIEKYGKENFKKEILQYCDTEEELNEFEKYWIRELNSYHPIGYNISSGGDGGDNFTNNPNKEEIRKKLMLNDSLKRNSCNWNGRKHTEDSKQKMSKSKKGQYLGENNPNYGKNMSDENKQKMSERQKGICYEDRYGLEKANEIKEKLKNNILGKKIGPSPKMIGENNPAKRDEVRKILSDKKKENDKYKIVCEYCNREYDKQNYFAWHGDKCKHKIK